MWLHDEAGGARAHSSQVALACALFPRFETVLDSVAEDLLRNHAVWFEGRPISPTRLAAELRITQLQIPPDTRDATLHASHPALSGHVIEIALDRSGAVTHVGLLG